MFLNAVPVLFLLSFPSPWHGAQKRGLITFRRHLWDNLSKLTEIKSPAPFSPPCSCSIAHRPLGTGQSVAALFRWLLRQQFVSARCPWLPFQFHSSFSYRWIQSWIWVKHVLGWTTYTLHCPRWKFWCWLVWHKLFLQCKHASGFILLLDLGNSHLDDD